MDWELVGKALGGIGVGLGALWLWISKQQAVRADVRADVARSESEAVVADANSTVYRLLVERVTTLEAEMRAVRGELSVERAHSRKLELHIFKLEGFMRKAGLEPPVFGGE